MLKFSFIFLFVLNNTSSPTPAFTATPDIKTGIDITFSTNSSVNITDDAQFGINPISPAIIGPNTRFWLIKFAIASSPINVITPFITNVIKNINTIIFSVCFAYETRIHS